MQQAATVVFWYTEGEKTFLSNIVDLIEIVNILESAKGNVSLLFSTLFLDQADSDAAACPSMHWAEGKETVWSVSGCDTAVLTNEQSCCPKKIFPFPPHDGVYQRAPPCLSGHINAQILS